MRVAVIVPFLNEAEHLPTFLASIAAQARRPDLLVLVDDGSSDRSPAIVTDFARDHAFVRVMRLDERPRAQDRLAEAAELRAFHAALATIEPGFDVIAKMDADLHLVPDHVQTVMERLEAEPSLGICGGYLSVRAEAGFERESHPAWHVRGPNKFYRRECLEQIEPLPEILGWDTIDDTRARMYGWVTASVPCGPPDSVHLRPTGMYDGRLRAYRRWGRCAWGYGSDPLVTLIGAVARVGRRPFGIAAAAYLYGYLHAAVVGAPRADPDTRRHGRREQRKQLVGRLRARLPTSGYASPE